MAIAMVIPFLLAGPAYADAAEDIAVQPPEITVILLNNQQVADGLLFVAPKVAGISGGTSPTPVGPEIVDNKGRPVWSLPVTNGQSAADFRVQKYHNLPVPTWAQEKGFGGLAQNESVDYIWNGATDVFLWDVLDASGEVANRDLYDGERSDRDRDDKRRITSTNWNSLDTTIAVDKYLTFVQVIARDQFGRDICRSNT